MTADRLEITIAAGIRISQEDAARCLQMLEWFVNDNKEWRIDGETDSGGYTHLYFSHTGEQK